MNIVVLTKYGGKFLGPIAKYILGPILNAIFTFLNWIKIPNIGIAIILFTIVIYILMLPLTIKQQKFSKLQAKMNPEIQAIQKKYKDKRDQESQMAMSRETQEVYAKYGVSPTGSCVQLLIQMPILFALYRVIYSIPAYVNIVKNAFNNFVLQFCNLEGAKEFIVEKFCTNGNPYTLEKLNEFATLDSQSISGITDRLPNAFIDILNKVPSSSWSQITEKFPNVADALNKSREQIDGFNSFCGINIGNSPSFAIKNANGKVWIIVVALLIPILSAVTQWINVKLTPQAATNNNNPDDKGAQMAQSMKMMNVFMPIFSAIMCYTLPAGLGIYWIAGSVVRSVQQVAINKYIDKMDLEEEIKKNVEKRNAKLRKRGIDPEKLTSNANISTKRVQSSLSDSSKVSQDKEAKVKAAYDKSSSKPANSIAAKANLVKQYNEKNNNSN